MNWAAEGTLGCSMCSVNENSRKVRAVVMRYGCRQGEFFEGCELRCGERTVGPNRSAWRLGAMEDERAYRSGNASNPVWHQVAIYLKL